MEGFKSGCNGAPHIVDILTEVETALKSGTIPLQMRSGMIKCDHVDRCSFLTEMAENMPITAHVMTNIYCYGYFTQCEFHKATVDNGGDNLSNEIPPDDGYHLSDEILNWVICSRLNW